MHNLVIIGNGFDLAHGLKTSYHDFIEFILRSRFKNIELYTDLIQRTSWNTRKDYTDFMKEFRNRGDCGIVNLFFKKMLEIRAAGNWCDIENLYYNELEKNVGSYHSVSGLNEQFGIIKQHLEIYLSEQQSAFKKAEFYTDFFASITEKEGYLILNFNYTDTVSHYLPVPLNNSIVHIHGQLKNDTNPIIFGFAANDEESRKLIDKHDKEYMRNIKKHNYKRTRNEKLLRDYLDGTPVIDVLILGHSCGISDKLILNQIFNHKNIKSIRTFYYEQHESYFETQVNIDRIMNNDDNFRKLVDFASSHRMPQSSDAEDKAQSFIDYLSMFYNEQKQYRVAYEGLIDMNHKN